jgi:hypothetical protein
MIDAHRNWEKHKLNGREISFNICFEVVIETMAVVYHPNTIAAKTNMSELENSG